jgi:uncharacterized DUF497 family protein
MKIAWHEAKRQQNLRDHQLDFVEAHRVFAGPAITWEDTRFDYDEWRFITVGLLYGRVVVLSHTRRSQNIHMISMRKGTKREEIRFYKHLHS